MRQNRETDLLKKIDEGKREHFGYKKYSNISKKPLRYSSMKSSIFDNTSPVRSEFAADLTPQMSKTWVEDFSGHKTNNNSKMANQYGNYYQILEMEQECSVDAIK